MVAMSPEQLRQLRESLGLPMKAFGQLVGVSEAQVSRWESGISHPPYKRWARLNELAKQARAEREGQPA